MSMSEKFKPGTVWGNEPAAVVSFFRVLIYALVLFGLPLDIEQQAAMLLVIESGLTLVTRSQVKPVSKIEREIAETEAANYVNPISPPSRSAQEVVDHLSAGARPRGE